MAWQCIDGNPCTFPFIHLSFPTKHLNMCVFFHKTLLLVICATCLSNEITVDFKQETPNSHNLSFAKQFYFSSFLWLEVVI